MEVIGQLHAPDTASRPTHCMGSWMGFRAGLNVWRKEKYFAAAGN